MRSVTRKHFSIIEGRPRFAEVTVAELRDVSTSAPQPRLLLNGREVQPHSPEDEKLIRAAIEGVRETEARFSWSRVPHHVVKIESLVVDVHTEAARAAAVLATTALIEQRR